MFLLWISYGAFRIYRSDIFCWSLRCVYRGNCEGGLGAAFEFRDSLEFRVHLVFFIWNLLDVEIMLIRLASALCLTNLKHSRGDLQRVSFLQAENFLNFFFGCVWYGWFSRNIEWVSVCRSTFRACLFELHRESSCGSRGSAWLQRKYGWLVILVVWSSLTSHISKAMNLSWAKDHCPSTL